MIETAPATSTDPDVSSVVPLTTSSLMLSDWILVVTDTLPDSPPPLSVMVLRPAVIASE
ncbi:hypothetical protein D3C83_77400 [compost metagenome]